MGRRGAHRPQMWVSFHPFTPPGLLLMLVFYFFLDSSSVLTHPAHLFPSGTTPGSALPACQHPTPGSAPPHPLRVTALPKARVWINEAQMPDWGLRLQVLALEQQLGSPTAPCSWPSCCWGSRGTAGEQVLAAGAGQAPRREPRERRGWDSG